MTIAGADWAGEVGGGPASERVGWLAGWLAGGLAGGVAGGWVGGGLVGWCGGAGRTSVRRHGLARSVIHGGRRQAWTRLPGGWLAGAGRARPLWLGAGLAGLRCLHSGLAGWPPSVVCLLAARI